MNVDPPYDLLTGNHELLGTAPQAGADLQREHLSGMLCPRGREICIVDMIRGWLSFADTWGDATARCIGEDRSMEGVLGEWLAMGRNLRKMLPKIKEHLDVCAEFGDPACRLNFATLDRMIVAAMEWQSLGLQNQNM